MSWLSELKWSNRLEHLYAMIAGDAELDETVPSTYDRKQGFLYKIAEKIAELSEGGGGSGGGGVTVVTFTQSGDAEGDAEGNTKGTVDTVYQADKTVAQIKEAFLSGAVVFDLTAFDGGQYICTGVVLDGDYFFEFGAGGEHTAPASQLTDCPEYIP